MWRVNGAKVTCSYLGRSGRYSVNRNRNPYSDVWLELPEVSRSHIIKVIVEITLRRAEE